MQPDMHDPHLHKRTSIKQLLNPVAAAAALDPHDPAVAANPYPPPGAQQQQQQQQPLPGIDQQVSLPGVASALGQQYHAPPPPPPLAHAHTPAGAYGLRAATWSTEDARGKAPVENGGEAARQCVYPQQHNPHAQHQHPVPGPHHAQGPHHPSLGHGVVFHGHPPPHAYQDPHRRYGPGPGPPQAQAQMINGGAWGEVVGVPGMVPYGGAMVAPVYSDERTGASSTVRRQSLSLMPASFCLLQLCRRTMPRTVRGRSSAASGVR
jgi:hypothetical protein